MSVTIFLLFKNRNVIAVKIDIGSFVLDFGYVGKQNILVVMQTLSLQWRHNGPYSVSNHQPHDCLLNRLSRRRSKKTSKLRVTGLCAWNSPGTGEFPAQMASNAENVSIWWRHLDQLQCPSTHWFTGEPLKIWEQFYQIWLIHKLRSRVCTVFSVLYLKRKYMRYKPSLRSWLQHCLIGSTVANLIKSTLHNISHTKMIVWSTCMPLRTVWWIKNHRDILTHWGRMPHICISKSTIIGSDNVAWSAPSHFLYQCWNIVNWTPRNKLQSNLN